MLSLNGTPPAQTEPAIASEVMKPTADLMNLMACFSSGDDMAAR
jgi:hypothetical protein